MFLVVDKLLITIDLIINITSLISLNIFINVIFGEFKQESRNL